MKIIKKCICHISLASCHFFHYSHSTPYNKAGRHGILSKLKMPLWWKRHLMVTQHSPSFVTTSLPCSNPICDVQLKDYAILGSYLLNLLFTYFVFVMLIPNPFTSKIFCFLSLSLMINLYHISRQHTLRNLNLDFYRQICPWSRKIERGSKLLLGDSNWKIISLQWIEFSYSMHCLIFRFVSNRSVTSRLLLFLVETPGSLRPYIPVKTH